MTRDGGRMADTTELLERESQLSELSGLLDSARSEQARCSSSPGATRRIGDRAREGNCLYIKNSLVGTAPD